MATTFRQVTDSLLQPSISKRKAFIMLLHSDFNQILAETTPQIDQQFAFYAPETATTHFPTMRPKQVDAARRLFSVIRRKWRDWVNDRHLRQSVERLHSLSPHLLEDVGLHQSESEVSDIQSRAQTVNQG